MDHKKNRLAKPSPFDMGLAATSQNSAAEAQGPKVWAHARKVLRSELGADVFEKWIASTAFAAEVDGDVVLASTSRVERDRILRDYMRQLMRVWNSVDPRHRKVRLESLEDLPAHLQLLARENQRLAKRSEVAVDSSATTADQASQQSRDLTGDDGYAQSFETLVVGDSNELAAAVARNLVDDGAGLAPVVLFYGPHGVGKTHIMRAIERAKTQKNGEKSAVYMSAEEFMLSFVEGVKKKDTSAQRKRIRKASIVLLDDLQFIASRKGTLNEFFLHLRYVTENGGKVVLSADAAPTRLESLDGRMRDEIQGGVVVEIHEPDAQMRADIVQSKVDLIARDCDAFSLENEWVEMIADRLPASGRALYGAVRNIFAGTILADKPITESAVEAAIRLQVGERRAPKIDTIKDVVAKFYDVTKADLDSPVRRRNLARPRQIAMYFARKLTKCSFPQIGMNFGKRDHTTVIYGDKTVRDRIVKEPAFKEELDKLESLILNDPRNSRSY